MFKTNFLESAPEASLANHSFYPDIFQASQPAINSANNLLNSFNAQPKLTSQPMLNTWQTEGGDFFYSTDASELKGLGTEDFISYHSNSNDELEISAGDKLNKTKTRQTKARSAKLQPALPQEYPDVKAKIEKKKEKKSKGKRVWNSEDDDLLKLLGT